jgi:hypothetical protein
MQKDTFFLFIRVKCFPKGPYHIFSILQPVGRLSLCLCIIYCNSVLFYPQSIRRADHSKQIEIEWMMIAWEQVNKNVMTAYQKSFEERI